MSKVIHEFNDMIRKLRKELFGKGPERIHTVFVENMAVSTLYGNLTLRKCSYQDRRKEGYGPFCTNQNGSGCVFGESS